jgi:hypothetical protein
MALDEHRTASGFSRLLDEALSMNGGGRYRSVRWREAIAAIQNPQRLDAERESDALVKIQSELHGDMQSQAEMP